MASRPSEVSYAASTKISAQKLCCTLIANEWNFTSMSSLVHIKLMFPFEGHVALITFISILWIVILLHVVNQFPISDEASGHTGHS